MKYDGFECCDMNFPLREIGFLWEAWDAHIIFMHLFLEKLAQNRLGPLSQKNLKRPVGNISIEPLRTLRNLSFFHNRFRETQRGRYFEYLTFSVRYCPVVVTTKTDSGKHRGEDTLNATRFQYGIVQWL